MKIPRYYLNLSSYLQQGKVLVLYGPRQVGKTTLIKDFLETCDERYKLDSGDDIRVQEVLSSDDIMRIKGYAEGYDLIVIDEAQRIPGIGRALKIMVDHVPGLKVIATGSSSFELAGQIGEPLTGRKITLTLFPIAQLELKNMHNEYELKERLEKYLVFGAYPEVITTEKRKDKISLLEELMSSYLLKDILELDRVKGSKVILDILRLLAFQVGQEVAHNEIAQKVGKDVKTIARYLDLLEKSFVVYNVRGYSRNLRSEITRKGKYFFFDIGMRNAVISNFNRLELRNDVGALWENFLFMERIKKRLYHEIYAQSFFWRTWEKNEIDLIEEREGKLFAYEFKLKSGKGQKPPRQWIRAYPDAEYTVVSQDNYLELII